LGKNDVNYTFQKKKPFASTFKASGKEKFAKSKLIFLTKTFQRIYKKSVKDKLLTQILKIQRSIDFLLCFLYKLK
jgi:hypothetical protein